MASWTDPLNTSDGCSPSDGEAIYRQQDDRADDRHDEPDGIAIPVQTDQTAHVSTDATRPDQLDVRPIGWPEDVDSGRGGPNGFEPVLQA